MPNKPQQLHRSKVALGTKGNNGEVHNALFVFVTVYLFRKINEVLAESK